MLTSFRTLSVCLIAIGAAAGCGDSKAGAPTAPTPPGVSINITMTMQPGQTSGVSNTPLSVTFDRVTEDSRCPAAALCISSGQAVISMAARADSSQPPQTFALATINTRDSVVVAGYTIKLESVTPYPVTTFDEIPATAYRANLRISR